MIVVPFGYTEIAGPRPLAADILWIQHFDELPLAPSTRLSPP